MVLARAEKKGGRGWTPKWPAGGGASRFRQEWVNRLRRRRQLPWNVRWADAGTGELARTGLLEETRYPLRMTR